MFRHWAIVRFSLKYLGSNYTYNACVHALMERSLHQRLLGGNLKTRLEKLHCRPVKQDEAAAKLGYGLRSFDTGQACPVSSTFSY
jgi:hypothetical protein